MSKRNVLFFLNSFWNNGRGMSGGDQMLIQIFKRIRIEFGNIYCYTNIDGQKVISDDVEKVQFITSPRIFDKFPLIINYILRTIKAFSSLLIKDVHIIYSGSDFFPDVLPSFIYKLFHPRTKWFQCIFHIYPNWKIRQGSKVKNFVAQYLQIFSFLFVGKTDVIININRQVTEELIRLGFKNRIIVNTPGIDNNYFNSLNTVKDLNRYDATFLARLNHSKGIFDLIEIWKIVIAQMPESRLAVIGGGSHEIIEQLNKKIEEGGLKKNINILKFLENDKSFSIIKNSKVFLFPSHEEGFGIAIAEAMACGVPVISWNLPVYREVFEDNCIQVEENNINLFSQKVIELLKNEDLRKKLSNKAREFVNKYSWDSIARTHLEILTKEHENNRC